MTVKEELEGYWTKCQLTPLIVLKDLRTVFWTWAFVSWPRINYPAAWVTLSLFPIFQLCVRGQHQIKKDQCDFFNALFSIHSAVKSDIRATSR